MNIDLRKVNFCEILKLDINEPEEYSITNYFQNDMKHPLYGYCTLCDELGCNTTLDEKNEKYRLTNISHGSHTADFLDALENNKPDITDWHEEGVMFLFETPSLDYKIFRSLEFNGFNKRPAEQWYWIHERQEICEYPIHFKGMTYGLLILSMINTFKLKNAYITNFVKCGMNNEKGNFKGLDSYPESCVKNCYENVLKKELRALEPKVIFTMGSCVDRSFNKLIQADPGMKKLKLQIINLPHPAGRRRGFKDSFYKTLYYWMVAEGLYKSGILTLDEFRKLAENYVK